MSPAQCGNAKAQCGGDVEITSGHRAPGPVKSAVAVSFDRQDQSEIGAAAAASRADADFSTTHGTCERHGASRILEIEKRVGQFVGGRGESSPLTVGQR